MFQTRRPIHSAAESRRIVHSLELFQRVSLGDEISALPNPIPRIKEISTIANDCRDEPKSSAMDREAKTSKPIEMAPVEATIIPANRNPFPAPFDSSATFPASAWFAAIV